MELTRPRPRPTRQKRRRWNDERWAAVRRSVSASPTASRRSFSLRQSSARASVCLMSAAAAAGPRWPPRVRSASGGASWEPISQQPLHALAVRGRANNGSRMSASRVSTCRQEVWTGDPFDVALSQFGVMFFDEPVVAFADIRAHLRPGGRLVFACCASRASGTPGASRPRSPTCCPRLQPPLRGKSPRDRSRLPIPGEGEILREAGFVEVGCSPYELEVEAPPESVVDEVQFELMEIPPPRSSGHVSSSTATSAIRRRSRTLALPARLPSIRASNR